MLESNYYNYPLYTLRLIVRNLCIVFFPFRLTTCIRGRLGNQLNQFASSVGISFLTNHRPALLKQSQLWKYFDLEGKVDQAETQCSKYQKQFRFFELKSVCIFEPDLVRNVNETKGDVILNGFFASWVFYEKQQKYVRNLLQFSRDIQSKVDDIFQEIKKKYVAIQEQGKRVLYIAVHVRRGDFLKSKSKRLGRRAAPIEYYIQAIHWFKKNQSGSELLFIVASNDKTWVTQNFVKIKDTKFYFLSENNSAIIDMAVLARCNHTIMSTGSYSYWSAFLANGFGVYYSGHPVQGSQLAETCPQKNFYQPKWMALP